MNLRKQFFTVWVFFVTNFKRLFRDKTALFFTFLFPMIFLFVFGFLNRNSGVSFRVAFINQSDQPVARQFADGLAKQEVLKIDTESTTLEKAKLKMTRGQLDATIILPANFGAVKSGQSVPSGQAQVLYTQNSAQAGQAIQSILQSQYFAALNRNLVKNNTPFTATAEQLNEKSLSSFDYAFAGLLGFAILGSGIFGPINIFPELKKQGILRRMHTTPLRAWQYFLSVMLGNAVVGLMTLGLMFAVAMSPIFNLKVAGNFLELAIFLVFSLVLILGIGLSIGGWAKNERQAAPLANIIVFPMMFLSGTFFPRFAMPGWLQGVTNYFPLTPVIDGARLIATEGQHLTQIGAQLGVMAVWLVIVYAIAFRVFRWE
jgi:ABC-2 type transport system permease protein